MVDLHAAPRRDLRRTLPSRRQSEGQEVAVVNDIPMCSSARCRQGGLEGFARTLPKRRMVQSVVNLVCVLRQQPMKIRERPRGMVPGVNAFGHLPSIASGLRVAGEVMKEPRVGCAEQAFPC